MGETSRASTVSPPHCRVDGHWEGWKGQACPAHPEAGQGQGSVQIRVGTGSHTPRLASAVSAVRLLRAGGCCWLHWSQISCSWELEMPRFSFFCVGLSGCYSPSVSLLMSLLLPAFHVPSGLSWPAPVILGLLGPSSHASVAQEWQREQECLLLPLPFPKLIYPFTAPPGNSAQTQKHSQTHPHG